MRTGIQRIVDSLSLFLIEIGSMTGFTIKIFRQFFRPPLETKEIVRWMYVAGAKTLPLVGITGFIMGLVLTLQSRPVLVNFGAELLLPSMISISIIREISPVITALLCAGKISSGFAAEIGSMKVTEQIDAMEVSGTNPMGFVVASRVLATTIMVPILVIINDAIALIGSYIAASMYGVISFRLFFLEAIKVLSFTDVIPATIKTVIFGFFIGMIGCYKGYNAGHGTEAVGIAANSAVVAASLSIFIIDLVAVQVVELLL